MHALRSSEGSPSMNRYALTLLVLVLVSLPAFAQTPDAGKSNGNGSSPATSISPAPTITDKSSPTELAAAALAAQGGDKFKSLKSTWVTGDANLYAPNSSQSLPGKFSMVTAGEKIRIDINAQPVFTSKSTTASSRTARCPACRCRPRVSSV